MILGSRRPSNRYRRHSRNATLLTAQGGLAGPPTPRFQRAKLSDQRNMSIRFALPHDDDRIAQSPQRKHSASISRLVRSKLGLPEGTISLRRSRPGAAIVTVPKAAVHEYDPVPRSICGIWRSRKVAVSDPVAMTELSKGSADRQLRSGPVLAYSGHARGRGCVDFEIHPHRPIA